ncbi:MAG: acyltransferase [Alphaproteobacteria bacterium]|nr:acyltransferase [Alphaproteobacteria bacterium]
MQPNTKPFTIGLIQMAMSKDKAKTLTKAISMLEEAAKKGVQVACLPELFLTEYFCQSLDAKNFDLAESVDGPTTQALAALAKKTGMVIVNSIYERAAAGLYYNTAVVIEKDGSIAGIYRKMHIPHDPLFEEKYYFAPGDLGFKAHDISVGKIGTLVCWDQWYPEGARLTAMQGAQVLFYPTAIGWHPAEKAQYGQSQVEAWETIQRSHAIANGVYVASCNRVGHEVITGDGIEFFGHSFIADPFGRILAMGSHDKEEILTAVVDPAQQEYTRRNWPFFRDRRVDAYGDITKRFGA